ncbi:MAG TPA: hypothetical protein VMF69_19975 [Gemmataceae bacterium]|nr:hypothetical protein [Gemmataceae bacterium]
MPAPPPKDGPRPDSVQGRARTAPPKRRPAEEEEILDVLPVEEENEIEVFDELEVIEEPRRRPKPKPRRRRLSERENDLIAQYYGRENSSSTSPLLLLCVPAPLILLIVAGSFIVDPGCGLASLLWAAGWIWLNLTAVEDGWGKILCINFVPFYALIYTIQNFDRTFFPFILIVIGNIAMGATSAWAKKNNRGRWVQGSPAPLVCILVSRFPEPYPSRV